MKNLIACAFALGALGFASAAGANGGVSFIAERYYFDLSYGKVSLAAHQTAPTYEFYRETQLPGSTIWKVHFRSILRNEFPSSLNPLPVASPRFLSERCEILG